MPKNELKTRLHCITFFGNEVKQLRGMVGQVPAIQTKIPTWAEDIGDGEFFPIDNDGWDEGLDLNEHEEL